MVILQETELSLWMLAIVYTSENLAGLTNNI